MTAKSHEVRQAGDRLDHYLAAEKLCLSRSEAARLIKDGFVWVNERVAKPSYKVRAGDRLTVERPPVKATEITPRKIDFKILYEDKDILVLDKPAGLVVHPGAGNYDESLVHGLLYHCSDLSGIGGVERPGIVHRLDKGTSGVMVVAKSDRAHRELSRQFKGHEVEKEYVALCLGSMAIPEQTLETLIKRAEVNRKKFVVNQKKGRPAVTKITVLKKGRRVSLVAARPRTGRTHQIRVHLRYIGHPIVGDGLYGGTKKLDAFNEGEKKFIRGLGRFLLHAKTLKFTHPVTGRALSFVVAPHADFERAVQKLF